MKVNIKNYQAIKNAELEFVPGITVIVGNSNNGKSSIIRAIEAAINNKGGSSFINYDATECSVEIEDNQNSIIWNKSKKAGKSSYILNGMALNKIGQKQLDEVGELLNMPEISINTDRIRLNFWKQMDFPFLVGKTPYQLFDFISKSKDQELMASFQVDKESILKVNSQEISSLHSNINLRTTDIAKAEEEANNLEQFNAIDTNKFDALINIYNTLDESLNNIATLDSWLKEASFKFSNNTTYIEALDSQLDSLNKIVKTYSSLDKLFNKLDSIDTTISINKEKLIATDIKIIEDNIIELKPLVNELNSITNDLDAFSILNIRYDTASNRIASLKQTQMITKSNIKEIENELKSFKFCPMCNQPLHNHEDHMKEEPNE